MNLSKYSLKKYHAVVGVLLSAPTLAFAGGGDDLGITSPLKTILAVLTGPVIVTVTGVAIASVGLLYVISEQQGPMKTILRVVIGAAVVICATKLAGMATTGAMLF